MSAISQSSLARELGISKQAVSKLKARGMPVDSIAAAQAWREVRQNVAARKAVPAETRAKLTALPSFSVAGMELPDDLEEARDSARTRREIAEANIAEMEESRLRRELIRLSAVQAALATDYSTTRDALLQIPARMGPLLAAAADPAEVQNLLHAEIHQALVQLAGAADRVPNIEGGFE